MQIDQFKGLSSEEIPNIRKVSGWNELRQQKEKNVLQSLYDILKEPMVFLLVLIGLIYTLIGDLGEAMILSASVALIVIITFIQEGKTSKALKALREMASPRCMVIRDAAIQRLDGRELVPGDYILLSEGDRIPADSNIVSTQHLKVDESILTGESISVTKNRADTIYCGTLVVNGEAVCEVKSIGESTEIGKIGKKIAEENLNKTRLELEVEQIVRIVFIFAMLLCLGLALYLGVSKGDWLKGILSGLTLAIGILPEELPLVLTIFFAFGAYRLSKKNVLTRKTRVIESLGTATILCTDKTGTLTQNRMSIKKIHTYGSGDSNEEEGHWNESSKHIVFVGARASKESGLDPVDLAFLEARNKFKSINLQNEPVLHWLKDFPITQNILAFASVYQHRDTLSIFAKGAPETILSLSQLDEKEKHNQLAIVNRMAKEGYRIIAVAKAIQNSLAIPEELHDLQFEYLGFVGLEDPIREEVPNAIQRAYQAGLRTIMITGDFPETAKHIARKIGLKNPDSVCTGEEFRSLREEDSIQTISNVNIFCRVSPEDKWQIVKILKGLGEVVAMTGDGVNDAPALKTADIGVAMGKRGTDVAREASDLVLLDDSFSSILSAVEEGRHIFHNLKKALAYILAVHIPIIGCAFLPSLLHLPFQILSAVHIVFLEMIIDPTSTLVFEREPVEVSEMNKPPRKSTETLFDKSLFLNALAQGSISLISIMLAYFYVLKYEANVEDDPLIISTVCFYTLVFTNLLLIMVNRNSNLAFWETFRVPNSVLPIVVMGTLFSLYSAIYIPVLQKIFHFAPLNLKTIAFCSSISILTIVVYELRKIIFRRKV
ncbi:putative calcium-translocating P-type ATPase, PMCA-type [Leptospira ryugenii]|uniref:Putative calcium-translocating P-type ATPase, PMCA-type n=1 Tax=Leptospira ryugenii TaxID=1917863 RepID=A0A2P2DZ53_9LEPT|nr:cation-translocating P-type ATPase [Leptospira ryugenii]GBF49908.1 putative calcium-translocating P-type ATPase, PMCA-type [Leptospira ryugenii]